MKIRYLVPAFALALTSMHASAAGSVKVEWQDPDSYTDIRPVNQTRSSYKRFVFKELEEQLTELADDLPDGHTLAMTVTDLDLAGQVWPGNFVGFGQSAASDVRLIRSLYIPRMSFSYTLTDAGGNTVQSAEVKLKDMMFMDRAARGFRSDSLTYEKTMLRDWFNDTMGPLVASTN